MSIAMTTPIEPALERSGALPDEGQGNLTAVSIVGLAVGLMGIGAVMTFSATASPDQPVVTWPIWEVKAVRQLAFVAAGLVAMLVAARIPYTTWTAGRGWMSLVLLLASLGALSLVFVDGIGIERNGARRWVEIPGTALSFQPSELVKVTLPIFLAAWMVHRVRIRSFFLGVLPLAVVAGVCIAVIGLEDFGTAALLLAVTGGMLLMGGARWLHLGLFVLPTVPAFAYLLISKPHRIERLKIYLDPWSDPEGAGYQITQSLSTIASGGLWGRGLGNGFVKSYLPMAQNDFIFAVICEELGVIGAMAVVGLLIALMWQGRKVVQRCPDPVGRLLALGIVLTLGLQATMNIAVVTASVPTKGIALPLVSAGGSGAIFLGALVGVLASIARCPATTSPVETPNRELGTEHE